MKMIADYKINFKKSTSHERQRKSEIKGEGGRMIQKLHAKYNKIYHFTEKII